MIPHGKGSVVANTMMGNAWQETSPIKFDDYAIFQARMMHPTGTLVGERIQKALSIQELGRAVQTSNSE